MKLLKRKKKPLPIGKPLKAIDLIGAMVEKGLLKTTSTGAFYTFPEILKMGHDPKSFAKNLFLYARTCKLINEGETLYIRCIEHNTLLAQYDTRNGYVPIS